MTSSVGKGALEGQTKLIVTVDFLMHYRYVCSLVLTQLVNQRQEYWRLHMVVILRDNMGQRALRVHDKGDRNKTVYLRLGTDIKFTALDFRFTLLSSSLFVNEEIFLRWIERNKCYRTRVPIIELKAPVCFRVHRNSGNTIL